MKPFDLEKAKAGAPVQTRNGKPARIICFDALYEKPICAFVTEFGMTHVFFYDEEGCCYTEHTRENNYDLMMVSVEKTGWVNIYEISGERHVSCIYPDKKTACKKQASEAVLGKYIDCIEISWEE